MATLTETAYVARKGIRYGAIGFVAITVLWFVGVGFVQWWKATHPEPLPPPTVDFGPLPPIEFPPTQLTKPELSLETPTGRLGDFPDRMQVFFAPNKRSSFGDADNAIETARRLGYITEPVKATPVYRWTTNDPLPSTLEVDIVSGHFELKSQWQADPTLLTSKRYLSDRQAILDAANYLRGRGLLFDDITGQETVSYWRAQGDLLVPAVSLSDAEFVRVEFYRKNYDQLDVSKKIVATYGFYTSKPERGLISVVLTGSADEKKRVVEVSNKYIEVDYATKGEYPIKSVELAFDELKNGQGLIASFKGTGAALIRRVNLGYLDTLGKQDYAMPIFVFTGDDDFVAYVSALSDEQVQKPIPIQ